MKIIKIAVVTVVGLALAIFAIFSYKINSLPGADNLSNVLKNLYAQDQAIRQAGLNNPIDIAKMMLTDWYRIKKVRRIVNADILLTAQDYANAARILQHGSKSSDFLKAQELSLKAFELGDEAMLRHSALAEDRYLKSIGKAQKYGSQIVCDAGGWHLYKLNPQISDKDRADKNIEPIDRMLEKVAMIQTEIGNNCMMGMEQIKIFEKIMSGQSNEN